MNKLGYVLPKPKLIFRLFCEFFVKSMQYQNHQKRWFDDFLSNLMDGCFETVFCIFVQFFREINTYSRIVNCFHGNLARIGFLLQKGFVWMKNWWKSFWRKILHIIAILSQWMPDKKWTTRSHCRATLGKENDQLFERHVLTDGFPMLLSQKK